VIPFQGLGGAFLRRRKRNGSSRRWTIKSKKPLGTPAIPTTCFGLLNVFFFWRGYSERVESLHLKVEELQREIALLHSTLKEKQNGPVALTLRDLQAVRLRKVSPKRRRSPLVTLADLQKVSLRRSNSDLPLKSRSSLGRTPTKNPMNLRVQLRKVNLMRSPGGTPLFNKENAVIDSKLSPLKTV
uniref:Proline rich 11 n=1 Tax=Sinocyclocheilus anshuiensis TaxID=1608454 RepID=A0A671RZW6_9TELE